jgi:hypothetical protein
MLWELEAIAGQLSLKRQHTLLAADGRCVTVIEWHKIGDRFQLAVGKLGAIHIVRTALPSTTGSSLQQEEVCRIPGMMVPVSVTWSADGNRFTTLTADGRCRVFVKSAGLMNRFEFDERASRKFIDQFQQIPRPFLNRSSSSSSSSSVHDRSSESISRLSADKITLLNNTYGVYLYGAASSFNGLCTAVVYKPYHKTDFGYSTDKSDVTLCDLQFANTGGDLTELNYPQLSNLLLDSSDSLGMFNHLSL